MTFKVDDRIFETSDTVGTGTYTLDGPVTGYQAFSELTANNYCPYFVTMDDSASWEAGIGQVLGSPARLARTHVLASSNADAAVDWGVGTKNVRCGQIAALAVPRRTSKSVAGASNVTLTQNEMRCNVLEFTGLLTGNIDVIVDNTVWSWANVFNNTTGAFTLTFKVTGQTGIQIEQGKSKALYCNGTDAVDAQTQVLLPPSYISGFTWANNSGDATNDIDIAAGSCTDSTGVAVIKGAAITKRLDAAWAVGTGNGGILSGSAANVDYNIWAIKRVDTGVVDVGFETAANATPTLPSGYTLYRKIGWFKRVAGTIVAFHTYETEGGGIEFSWDVPTADIALANVLGNVRRTDIVKVPADLPVIANLNVIIVDVAGTSTNICSTDQANSDPGGGGPINAGINNGVNQNFAGQISVRAIGGVIAARANNGGGTVDNYTVYTIGFNWARRV